MRSAYLDDAEPEAISHAIRDVLERRGALISEHRHSRIKFHSLTPAPRTWPRAGYVGIYQPIGEREAEVRLQLRARLPWRILWTVCIANITALLLAIILNLPGTTWSLLAIFGGLALLAASLLYAGTLKSVRELERDLMTEFETALQHIPDVELQTEEERELAELEQELEGEIVRRAIANKPKPKGQRFSLKPKKGETDDERRQRLLARKAELEAKKAEREQRQRP